MTLGHTIGVALGAITVALAAFLSSGGTGTAYDRVIAAIAAGTGAASTYLQYAYAPGVSVSPPPPS